jgi:hypothetical protein
VDIHSLSDILKVFHHLQPIKIKLARFCIENVESHYENAASLFEVTLAPQTHKNVFVTYEWAQKVCPWQAFPV